LREATKVTTINGSLHKYTLVDRHNPNKKRKIFLTVDNYLVIFDKLKGPLTFKSWSELDLYIK
ncbi:MAG: hypothetical protein AAGH46_09995, partial [Bacteroidota bacterium]